MDETAEQQWSRWQPEVLLPGLWRRIDGNYRLAFILALIFGAMTHLYMFVNKLPNGDDLESMYRNYDMTSSGRWFDQIAMSLSSWYSIPWTTGVVAVFFLALSVALLCSVFRLKRKSSIFLMAALLTTFPVLAAQFSYLFYADLYMIAMCLNVLAIWLAQRTTWGWLAGSIAIACAMGCYQAYLGMAVVICMLSLIMEIVANERSAGSIAFLTLRYLVTGGLGVIVYFGALQDIMTATGVALTDYQGINTMGQLPEEGILSLLPLVYQAFGEYFFKGTYFDVPVFFKGLYALVLLVGVALLIYGVVHRGCWRKPTVALLLILLAALPIGYNLIYFMAPDAFFHCLMQPQYGLFLLMPVLFWESAFPLGEIGRLSVTTSWILLLAGSLIAYQFYLTTNVGYLHLDLKYEITYANELRILDRIEQLEGYTVDTPVAFIGAFPNEHMSMYPDATNDVVKNMTGLSGNLVHHDKNYQGFYLNYLGKNLNVLTGEETWPYWPMAAEMPIWPDNGSVVLYEGVVIVHIR